MSIRCFISLFNQQIVCASIKVPHHWPFVRGIDWWPMESAPNAPRKFRMDTWYCIHTSLYNQQYFSQYQTQSYFDYHCDIQLLAKILFHWIVKPPHYSPAYLLFDAAHWSRQPMEIYSHSLMTSSHGNIFHVTGLLCGEFTGHPQIGQCRGVLVFSLIYAWTNGSGNNRDAGDFRRHFTMTSL